MRCWLFNPVDLMLWIWKMGSVLAFVPGSQNASMLSVLNRPILLGAIFLGLWWLSQRQSKVPMRVRTFQEANFFVDSRGRGDWHGQTTKPTLAPQRYEGIVMRLISGTAELVATQAQTLAHHRNIPQAYFNWWVCGNARAITIKAKAMTVELVLINLRHGILDEWF